MLNRRSFRPCLSKPLKSCTFRLDGDLWHWLLPIHGNVSSPGSIRLSILWRRFSFGFRTTMILKFTKIRHIPSWFVFGSVWTYPVQVWFFGLFQFWFGALPRRVFADPPPCGASLLCLAWFGRTERVKQYSHNKTQPHNDSNH